MEGVEKRKSIKVQVNITNSVQNDFNDFEGEETEALLHLIQVHETLTKDLKLNIAIYSSLLVGKIATKNENHIKSKKTTQRTDHQGQHTN